MKRFHKSNTGRAALRLPMIAAVRLERMLHRFNLMSGDGYEPLRRIKMDSGRIEALLRRVRAEYAPKMPVKAGEVRILSLARSLIACGERNLNREELIRELASLEDAHGLEMMEIQRMSLALNIALCEGFLRLCEEISRAAEMRRRAERWIRSGGRRRADCGDAFLAHALQLSTEMEAPQLHERAQSMVEKRGTRTGEMLERVIRRDADCCLRLENLLKTMLVIDETDWELCFRQVSSAEQELCGDPAEIYGGMDDASRNRVRRDVGEMARKLGQPEIALVRYALRAAHEAARERGRRDVRATVCWYFSDDEGRRELCREMGIKPCLKRRIPDAGGRKTAAGLVILAVLLWALIAWAAGKVIFALLAPPLAWVLAMQLVAGIYPRCVRPGHILKMQVEQVPDHARTLVVLPVLISSESRAREMIERMEALGCLERDINIDFLLLGDFRDAGEAELEDDAAILSVLRDGIARLNGKAERRKYFYLQRARSYRQADGRWMGENRKRGALMALNALLLGRSAAGEAFGAENGDAAFLENRYAYVLTLDADTEYLPGTVQKLVGAMLHPLNRKYGVLQPAMQNTADSLVNAYVEISAGKGGVDSYPVSVSDFWQDMTGRGCFAGKGIYDVRAFALATEGKLPDANILSHDLIEGILCGAGFLNDVCFYDGSPENLHSELVRLNRWTRGDWQLLPVIFGLKNTSAADRLKMIGNLLRSLYAPALTALLVLSAWMDAPEAFIVGILLAFREPLLRFGWKREWKRAVFQLACLPQYAACSLDAALRTLWRLGISGKHLMDWVPAADSGKIAGDVRLPGRIAALLLLPCLLRPFWAPAAVALALLFWVGGSWADELASQLRQKGALNESQHALLMDIARRTWAFFERYVPEGGCGLPPDNVQLDPPAGAAMRTSPTNIGLYLMSCLSARKLGFINEKTMLRRMHETVSTLEGMEKWNGQLYNWYDTRDLAPLRPRYVSSVDSGNLAGALLLCAQAVRQADALLSRRLDALAENMNLAALYDARRKLFFIGMDVESGRMSQSHYDLYASESRIASYAAMMLGQVPAEHWKHLSRTNALAGGRRTMLSWSGTMFEYLMPELLLRSEENTLAGESCRNAVSVQMRFGRAANRPWGVSESGYYAFDMYLNYQYRAFGLRELALSGNAVQDVVAPYASALALAVDRDGASENLRRMCEMGWGGELGMYEAADYLHLDAGRRPRIVRSHMAHHQGMVLCAICNALRDDVLAKTFMENPRARALRLLLQEKQADSVGFFRRKAPLQPAPAREIMHNDFLRPARDGAVDVHLLRGGETTALVTNHGGTFVWNGGVLLNRFSGDLRSVHDGMYVHIFDGKTGREQVIGRAGKILFDAGSACFFREADELRTRMHIVVSPENGALYHQLEIENTASEGRSIEICGCMSVALAAERDMRAHPVFQNLFIESEIRDECCLLFRRRRREPGEELPVMIFGVSSGNKPEWETDMEKLVGRRGALGLPGGINRAFSLETGNAINSCAALRVNIRLDAGQKKKLHFALIRVPGENADAAAKHICAPEAADRALQLASMQARAVLGHAGIDGRHFRLLQRASACILDARLRIFGRENRACESMRRSDLWQAGVSGDLPVILAEIDGLDGLDCVRGCLRMHAFYRMMGLQTDLVVINRHDSDYLQPVRSALADLIASSHLNGSIGVPGGVFVLEKPNMSKTCHDALVRIAALRFDGSGDYTLQLRGMLDGLNLPNGEALTSMVPGKTDFPGDLRFFNGYGGFDGARYAVFLRDGMLPPAPWSNIISSEQAGAIVTERGGGFAWYGNSRSNRLTAFANDVLREGWGWMFYLLDGGSGEWMRLLPGDAPMADFCVYHEPGATIWKSAAGGIAFEVEMRVGENGLQFEITLNNRGKGARHLNLTGFTDWLMGTDSADLASLRTWSRYGACFASGTAEGVGCFAADAPQVKNGCDRQSFLGSGDIMRPAGLNDTDGGTGGWVLQLPVSLRPGEIRRTRFLLGWAKDVQAAYALARDFRSGEALRRSRENWRERLNKLRIQTPDAAVNLLANGFLQAQILNGRIRGRTGLYQPGGAYGFRDQLQDMLPMIHYEPGRVRRHLLYCAARQFEAGDVLHWWHDPYFGVRTKISDDLLFLPWVTAQYVRITGDVSVLNESIPFLQDIEIPAGQEDIYAPMQPSNQCASLHEHCMRALRRAAVTGKNGLCLMGTGDWNDGMNRVGAEGRGESIWLTEFLAVCARDYADIAPVEGDAIWLTALSKRLQDALEARGWDGKWYLRAYSDDGKKLGSSENECCRIDLISQAWAVAAGLDEKRCAQALESAWEQLADEETGVIRLLDPPFDGKEFDPGYIAAYPPGVRENGAQYTHAACWMLCALAQWGDGARAHRALRMLLPVNHALTMDAVERYRVEPYVMAADVYSAERAGRGGWTWYTGSAAWMLMGILKLLGYERRGNRVKLHALLNDWPEASVEIEWGQSSYRLICRADVREVLLDGARVQDDWIFLVDDGREHSALFPARRNRTEE